MSQQEIGKTLLLLGISLCVIGALFLMAGDKLKWIGNLPGDIKMDKGNTKIYFPITTMILLSLAVTFIIRLWNLLK